MSLAAWCKTLLLSFSFCGLAVYWPTFDSCGCLHDLFFRLLELSWSGLLDVGERVSEVGGQRQEGLMYWARIEVPSRVALSSSSSVCLYLASSPSPILAFCLNPVIGSQVGD